MGTSPQNKEKAHFSLKKDKFKSFWRNPQKNLMTTRLKITLIWIDLDERELSLEPGRGHFE